MWGKKWQEGEKRVKCKGRWSEKWGKGNAVTIKKWSLQAGGEWRKRKRRGSEMRRRKWGYETERLRRVVAEDITTLTLGEENIKMQRLQFRESLQHSVQTNNVLLTWLHPAAAHRRGIYIHILQNTGVILYISHRFFKLNTEISLKEPVKQAQRTLHHP